MPEFDNEADARRAPVIGLMRGIGNNEIPKMEAQGQRDLINSNHLPAEITFPRDAKWSDIEDATGIKIIGNVNELFVEVELPKGWRLEATEHSMWSNLLDDKDAIVARIFYKAAHYDRRASIDFTQENGGGPGVRLKERKDG